MENIKMENIDYLSQLPVDVFLKQITYLPFDDVISVCNAYEKLKSFCTDKKYNSNWKFLIDDTFGNTFHYKENLQRIRKELNLKEDTFNYLVYTEFVKLLDPITQLRIYYRQGDMKSFENKKFSDNQRFLALFLLKKKDEMKQYLPTYNTEIYQNFIDLLEKKEPNKNILNGMMFEMAYYGSPLGVSFFLNKGADVHVWDDYALRWASQNGHLEVVKYLVEHGANIHEKNDYALKWASRNGHLEVVKYLVEHEADIHADNDDALRWASQNGHLEVVKYLVEHEADIHAWNDYALSYASQNGHLEVVKYLVEQGADVHADNDGALRLASENGHLDVVKYLVEHEADIHDFNDNLEPVINFQILTRTNV